MWGPLVSVHCGLDPMASVPRAACWGVPTEGTREPWEGWEQERGGDQTHRRSQQFQIQADRARMSVAQGGVRTQGQPLFRKRFPEEGTWELRQEGPVKRMSQAETWRWEELAQFGEQHTVQSCWISKWDLGSGRQVGSGHEGPWISSPRSRLCPRSAWALWKDIEQGRGG